MVVPLLPGSPGEGNRTPPDQLKEKAEALNEAQGLPKGRLSENYSYDKIVGTSEPMKKVFVLIRRVAETNLPVLIEGESGTGKELIANAIHLDSKRSSRPFIRENCAALTSGLLETELFGHVKGAFTGAVKAKKGLFEFAHGGTLFLDEIGDMSLDMQKKLFRVLEEGKIRRVGGRELIPVEVRVLSATNQDLKELVRRGEFREELLWRLNVIRIPVPPLRERKRDIPLLAEHFLRQAAASQEESPKKLTSDAVGKLLNHNWPGNVRELRNLMERTHLLAEGKVIQERDVVLDARPAYSGPGLESYSSDFRRAKEQFERWFLSTTLRRYGGVVSRAARACGISRETFHRLIHKYGIQRPEPPPE